MHKREFIDICSLLTDKQIACLVFRLAGLTRHQIAELRNTNFNTIKWEFVKIQQKADIDKLLETIEELIFVLKEDNIAD